MRKDKWAVYGENGGSFTNLNEAKNCAKMLSKDGNEYNVVEIETGICYIDYVNGKCVRDGWRR